jgi:Bacteriophage probable baseplate hub protein
MADDTKAASPNVDIVLAGKEVPDGHVLSVVVERDMSQPDMAAITLANQGDLYSTQEVGAPVEIKVKDGTIYKGEIVGLEPIYKGGDKSKILIRAMNKLHLLLRKRKSVTFTDKTDQQILNQVVGDASLTLEWKHETSITYKHVYQHNQTDLDFLRTRAARMGCHVWCVDTTVYVKQPELQGEGKPELNVDAASAEGSLRMFAPRLNSSGVLKKVTVKGWNPETKELISGDASVTGSQLGSETSVAGSKAHGTEESYTVDHPIWDKAEATALAKARLQEASLSYITGIAEVAGTGEFDLGKLVTITANANADSKSKDPFNGKYYIMGITHRYNASHAKDDSAYVTTLKLARDAQKQ